MSYKILLYLLIRQFMEKGQGVKDGDYSRIRGLNFQGQVQYSGELLKISATQFKKGASYTLEINNIMIQKEFRRFLVFKKTSQLFSELIDNYKMEISDQSSLVLPIQVSFKGSTFELKVEIPLVEKKYDSESQKIQDLYNNIAKINKFYLSLQKEKGVERKLVNSIVRESASQEKVWNKVSDSKLIKFKGDQSNANYRFFETSVNKIKNLAGGNINIYNHNEDLPKTGIFHFKFKILYRNQSSAIIAGICGKNIKSFVNDAATKSPYFMGFNLNKPFEYLANRVSLPCGHSHVYDNGTIFKVEINLDQKHVTWFINQLPFYLAKIPKDLEDVFIYPFVTLHNSNDSIEFITQD